MHALSYVRTGLGVTVMSDSITARGVAWPRLTEFHFTRSIGLVHAGDAERLCETPAIRALIDTVQEQRLGR